MTATPYNPDVFSTPANVDISPLSIKSALDFDVEVCAHEMMWWGSGSHLNAGYRSDDPAVIARQLAAMKQCGVDFVELNWYGTMGGIIHSAMMAWVKACEANKFPFITCMARGMFETYNMPKGQDITAWGVQQMQFAHDNFFISPMYKKTPDGRFLMTNFDWTGVKGLDYATILAPYSSSVAMLFEHSTGAAKKGSAGGHAWIGVSGKYDPETVLESYASDFLASMAQVPNKLSMSSLVWNFDDHNRKGGDPTKSCWDSTQPARYADWKQGQALLNIIAALNKSKFKPNWVRIATWNDIEENTAFERGIDSALTASLAAQNGVLTATLAGNLATVDHVDIYVNGSRISTQQPAASLTFDLSTLSPTDEQKFVCQAIAVGKPFFQNKGTSALTTTVKVIAGQTVQVSIPSVPVQVAAQNVDVPTGLPPNLSVPVSVIVGGLTVSGALDVAAPQTVSIPVPAQTVNIPLTQPVTVTINAQTTWS